MNVHFIVVQFNGYIAVMDVIVHEIFLDHVTFVAKTDNKFIESEMAVILHDMPEYRLVANLNHGLGFKMGFFGNPRTHSTGKNYNFHIFIFFQSATAAMV